MEHSETSGSSWKMSKSLSKVAFSRRRRPTSPSSCCCRSCEASGILRTFEIVHCNLSPMNLLCIMNQYHENHTNYKIRAYSLYSVKLINMIINWSIQLHDNVCIHDKCPMFCPRFLCFSCTGHDWLQSVEPVQSYMCHWIGLIYGHWRYLFLLLSSQGLRVTLPKKH